MLQLEGAVVQVPFISTIPAEQTVQVVGEVQSLQEEGQVMHEPLTGAVPLGHEVMQYPR